MSRIAILGTGLLGAGFAENLLSKGHDVVVWNRTAAKTDPLVALGATAAATPAQAVTGADRAHLVLTADAAVEAVIEACRPALAPTTWLVDHSTNAPDGVQARFAALRSAGVRYVPAPVFMSPANARSATGLMLLAGPAADAESLQPALEEMTGRVWHVGEQPERAAVIKLCGNAVLLGVGGLMGDLYAIGQGHSVEPGDIDTLAEMFQLGPLFSRIGARVQAAPTMPTSFALSMARKDVGLMIEAAGGRDPLTVLPAVADAMDTAIAEGDGDRDYGVMAWRGRPGGSKPE